MAAPHTCARVVKRHGSLFEKLASFRYLLRCARRASRGRRHRPDVHRFVKETLRVRRYIRYVDDLVLLTDDHALLGTGCVGALLWEDFSIRSSQTFPGAAFNSGLTRLLGAGCWMATVGGVCILVGGAASGQSAREG